MKDSLAKDENQVNSVESSTGLAKAPVSKSFSEFLSVEASWGGNALLSSRGVKQNRP